MANDPQTVLSRQLGQAGRQERNIVELICSGGRIRNIDVVKLGDSCFIQRLYVGIEPEEQTSRADKDKYGTFAYAINAYNTKKDQER